MDTPSPNTFNEVFLRHQRNVFAYIITLVPDRNGAEDVFQETCLKLLEKASEFDPSREFFPWACGFALNEVRRFRRLHHRERTGLDDVAIEKLATVQHDLARKIESRLDFLMECLAKLPADRRELLLQSYSHRGGITELAALLEIEPAALRKRLERLRKTVFECMEEAAKS